ncbi:RidA family protein [Sphingobium sp. SCG-1]|uniref:RidA family protein n=1 Tax=Sphingobium sp. SCG-1 TaxID=2072936 RepID=UPI001CB9B7E2|nr:RidA family protein [Sphingobium sp. SCG-1]
MVHGERLAAAGLTLPLSQAVEANGFVFVSGQLGFLEGRLVDGGIREQTQVAIDNIQAALCEHNLSLRDVVRVGIWLKSPHDFPVFNEVYAKHFGPRFPARATVVSDLMLEDAVVEIDAIAARPQ